MSDVMYYTAIPEGRTNEYEMVMSPDYERACDDRDAAQSELAALREELDKVNREKNDVACRANATAEALNSMAISKATMRNKLKQRLTDAEQRNADTIDKLELAASMMDDDERGNRFAEVCRIAIATLKPTESGASE